MLGQLGQQNHFLKIQPFTEADFHSFLLVRVYLIHLFPSELGNIEIVFGGIVLLTHVDQVAALILQPFLFLLDGFVRELEEQHYF